MSDRYEDEILYGRWVLRRLFQRGGVWYGRVRDLNDDRLYTKSSRKRDYRKGRKVILEWIDQLQNAGDARTTVGFKEAFEQWVGLKVLRASSRRDLDSALEVYLLSWSGLAVDRIDHAAVQAVMKDLADRKRTPRTRNKHLSILRGFFRWGVRQRYCDFDPTDGLRPAKTNPRRALVLTEAQARLLVGEAERRWKVQVAEQTVRGRKYEQERRPREHLWLALLLALHTGLRQRNVLRLRWEQVDLERRRIDLPGSEMKAHRDHSIPLHPELVDVLTAVLRQRGKCDPKAQVLGQPLQAVKSSFARLIERVGLPDLRWHDLRHSFATWVAARSPWAVVQRLLGHEPQEVTWDYVDLHWHDLEAAIDRLPRLLNIGKLRTIPAIVSSFHLPDARASC